MSSKQIFLILQWFVGAASIVQVTAGPALAAAFPDVSVSRWYAAGVALSTAAGALMAWYADHPFPDTTTTTTVSASVTTTVEPAAPK